MFCALVLMFLVMICALIVLLADIITETDEIKNIKENYSTKHICRTKHQSILPPGYGYDNVNFEIQMVK